MRRVCLLVLLLLSGFAARAAADQRVEQVAGTIQELIESRQLPSVAVAVARDGRILWEGAWGWADRERRVAGTPRTPYSLASISKPFTATAVMQLVEAGQVALDRPANDYLGTARIAGRDAAKATVRRLLSHTAGLPVYYRPYFSGPAPPMEQLIARDARVNGRPGRYVYSNLGYGILEHLVAQVSGTAYDEYLRRRLFDPLRLESASVPRAAPPGAAVRYGPDDQPLPFYDLGHRGASSVFASAHDLVRFGIFHLQGSPKPAASILTRKSIGEMQRVQTPLAPRAAYGLGWRIEDEATPFRRVEHTGGMPGVTAVLRLFPAQRVVVVVLANRRSEAVLRLADQLSAAVLPMYGWELRRSGRLERTN